MADDRTDNIEGLGQHPVRLIDYNTFFMNVNLILYFKHLLK